MQPVNRWLAIVEAPTEAAALHFQTRHGEQQTVVLADNSVLHLNTDSAATVRYGRSERTVTLTAGEALLQVVHDPARPFRVLAGQLRSSMSAPNSTSASQNEATLVTVVEGRIAVALRSNPRHRARESWAPISRSMSRQANWPAAPMLVDVQQSTAWLHRQIMFEHEPLARVALEFNRYAAKPIEIVSPSLQNLEISGVFATDDSEAFIAFLRSLDGRACRGDADTHPGLEALNCKSGSSQARKPSCNREVHAHANRGDRHTSPVWFQNCSALYRSARPWHLATPAALSQPAFSATLLVEIPPQPLAQALSGLASQTGLQMVYVSASSAPSERSGWRREFRSRRRSTQLLQGTGLRFQYLTAHSVRILAAGAGPKVVQAAGADDLLRDHRDRRSARRAAAGRPHYDRCADRGDTRAPQRHYFRRFSRLLARRHGARSRPESEQHLHARSRSRRCPNPGRRLFGPLPQVAIYLDDLSVQLAGRNLDLYTVDLDRIEVLEGPQGTLFGAGAEAGVLRYITHRPEAGCHRGHGEHRHCDDGSRRAEL